MKTALVTVSLLVAAASSAALVACAPRDTPADSAASADPSGTAPLRADGCPEAWPQSGESCSGSATAECLYAPETCYRVEATCGSGLWNVRHSIVCGLVGTPTACPPDQPSDGASCDLEVHRDVCSYRVPRDGGGDETERSAECVEGRWRVIDGADAG